MYHQIGDVKNARRLIRMSMNEGYSIPLHETVLAQIESEAARSTLQETAGQLVEKADADALETLARVGPGQQLEALRALGKQITDIAISMRGRSHAAQNMSYLVPGYNVYALGRSVVKGDAYFDNCVVSMPDAWFAELRPKVKLICNGRTFKPSDTAPDSAAGIVRLTFSRVLEQNDVVEKKQQRLLALRIESRAVNIEVEFEAKPVTPELQRQRPDLVPDAPYFQMRAVRYGGRTFPVKDGLIVDGQS
jgi:hypothetical protein